MSAPVYFISDLHLDASRPWVTSALEAFLQERRDAQSLYILGDLFEAWVGDDDDSDLAVQVAALLGAFSDAGPALFLMHGNRDFLMGERFAVRAGAVLIPDPVVVTEHGKKLLLMHGDSLCTLDSDYQAFRKQARSRQWQQEVLAKPLALRRELADQLRQMSMDAGSRKADDIMDVTERDVLAAMEAAGTSTLIHGHTHRPARHENGLGERWVLGDWDKTGWHIQLNSTEIKLVEFNINQ